jgi:hypothetical protein
MGKRGPAPKPTNLRLLHGDRRDRINTSEPLPADGIPVCPKSAPDVVREVWDYTPQPAPHNGTRDPRRPGRPCTPTARPSCSTAKRAARRRGRAAGSSSRVGQCTKTVTDS